MGSYFIIFILIVVLSVFEIFVKNDKIAILLFAIVSFVILLFQSLRWTTGTDWLPYYNFFTENFTLVDFVDSDFEIGFSVLNFLTKQVATSYTVYLLVFCGVNIWIYSKAIKQNEGVASYILFYLMFFAIFTFPIRQALAFSLVCFSYQYIIKKDFLKFLLVVMIATTIHRTSFIFLLAYFISNIKFKNWQYFAIFILSIIIGQTSYVYDFFFYLLEKLGVINDSVALQKLFLYMQQESIDEAAKSSTSLLISNVVSFVWLIVFVYFKEDLFKQDKRYLNLLNIYLLALFFNKIFLVALPDLARITTYFAFAQIVLFSIILNELGNVRKIGFILLIVGYYFTQLNGNINGKYKDLFQPYISVFDNYERGVY